MAVPPAIRFLSLEGNAFVERGWNALPRRIAKSVLLAAGLPSINGDDRSGGLEDRAEPSAAINQNAIQFCGALEHSVLVNVDRAGCGAICAYDDDSLDCFLSDVTDKTSGLCTVDISPRVLDQVSDGCNRSEPDDGSGIAVTPAAGSPSLRARASVIGAHDGVGTSNLVQFGAHDVAS